MAWQPHGLGTWYWSKLLVRPLVRAWNVRVELSLTASRSGGLLIESFVSMASLDSVWLVLKAVWSKKLFCALCRTSSCAVFQMNSRSKCEIVVDTVPWMRLRDVKKFKFEMEQMNGLRWKCLIPRERQRENAWFAERERHREQTKTTKQGKTFSNKTMQLAALKQNFEIINLSNANLQKRSVLSWRFAFIAITINAYLPHVGPSWFGLISNPSHA